METTASSRNRILLWFQSLGTITKGLLLGFVIPMALSILFGVTGLLLGHEFEDSPGSQVIGFAVMTFDLPGLMLFAHVRSWMGAGMLPGGDESMAMAFLVFSTPLACVFWSFIGAVIGWMIRMARV